MSPVAQICLYGTPASGFAFLTSRPGLARAIASKGGWNRQETRPSGDLRSLTETVEAAKTSLRALGVDHGEVIVFFPGGEHCARTPIDDFQPVGGMRIETAPVTAVTAKSVERAAHAIAKAKLDDPYPEEWHDNYVTWYRPARRGAERAPVAIIPGDLVWVAPGSGTKGHWGIARGFSQRARQVQVGSEWVEHARVLMRQEAIAEGIAAPAGADNPAHSPFALLIDALRSKASRAKTLDLLSADGVHHRLRIEAVANDLGRGSIGLVVVRGTIDGGAVELVVPTDYDATGAPTHPAELRWSPLRRIEVDPRSVRFAARAPRRRSAAARAASRTRSVPEVPPGGGPPAADAQPEERWDRHGVVWHRPSRTGPANRVELRHGDLVWVSFGASSARARGTWGRVQGFSSARRKVKVREQWFELPLVFTHDEASAQGVPPPPAAPAPKLGPSHAPFVELVRQLRSPDARGRTLELVSTDATPHSLRILRIEHDLRAIIVIGTIKKSEARLTVWTDSDANGVAKSEARLRKGTRTHRVDPRRIHFVAKDKRSAAGGTP